MSAADDAADSKPDAIVRDQHGGDRLLHDGGITVAGKHESATAQRRQRVVSGLSYSAAAAAVRPAIARRGWGGLW